MKIQKNNTPLGSESFKDSDRVRRSKASTMKLVFKSDGRSVQALSALKFSIYQFLSIYLASVSFSMVHSSRVVIQYHITTALDPH